MSTKYTCTTHNKNNSERKVVNNNKTTNGEIEPSRAARHNTSSVEERVNSATVRRMKLELNWNVVDSQ